MGWWERQAAKSQPIYDLEMKQWVEPDYRPAAWARGFVWISRLIATAGRLGLVVLLLIGILTLEWVPILVAVVMLAVSVMLAWGFNQSRPANERRRIWWP